MAQGIIGNLRVVLGLDSAQFSKGTAQAGKSLSDLRAGFQRIASVAAATGAALTAAIGSAAQSAAQIDRLSRAANAGPEAFQRWAAASATVGIEQEKLSDILRDVNDRIGDFLQTGGGPMADFFETIAPRVGVTAEQFARLSGPEALQLYVDSLQRANLGQAEMTFYMEALASDATLLLPLLRNSGAEMERLGQAAQDMGAVMSADTIRALSDLRVSFQQMGLVFTAFRNMLAESLVPVVQAVASGLTSLMQPMAPLRVALETVAANVGRLISILAVAVAWFGGRYVAALVAARVATATLAGSLVFLRGALIRTGIGVAVVAAGELVFQFGRLVSAAGGVGEAIQLLGDVAREVFVERMPMAAQAGVAAMGASWAAMRADFLVAVNGMRSALANLMLDAARVARFSPLFGAGMSGGLQAAGQAVLQGGEGLTETAARLRDVERDFAEQAASLGAAAQAPLESVGRLRDTVAGLGEEMAASSSVADGFTGALEDVGGAAGGASGGGGGGGAAGAAASALDGMRESASSLADTLKNQFKDVFKGLVKGTMTAKEAVASLLDSLADLLIDRAFNAIFAGGLGGGGGGGGLFGFLGNLFGGVPSFAGGGFTGAGSRSGGLDGRGGFMAMLHPNETVVDHARGGMRGEVIVRLDVPEGVTVGQARQIAGEVAVRVTAASSAQTRRALPSALDEIRTRGR